MQKSIEMAKVDLQMYSEIKHQDGKRGDDAREFEKQVEKALSKLAAEERRALTLTYIEGKTNEQAAEVDGCDPTTISRRKKRGLKHMAAALHAGQYIADNRMT